MTDKQQSINEMIEYSKGGVLSKVITKTKSIDMTLFCMAKGTELSEHASTKEGYVHILEGDGIFNMEGRKIRMHPGVLIHMNKNSVHSLKAKGNTSFLLTLSR